MSGTLTGFGCIWALTPFQKQYKQQQLLFILQITTTSRPSSWSIEYQSEVSTMHCDYGSFVAKTRPQNRKNCDREYKKRSFNKASLF
jgi:hypothetical protein